MATKQNGGWYWNPKLGKAEQYWEPKGGTSTDWQDTYNKAVNPLISEVNKYADELIAKANGDYDYASKWLESNYKVALGTDDQARAQFLKKVANDMEAKVGRIQYDYDTGKYRTEQDLSTTQSRLGENQSTALKRLSEDEKAFKTTYARQVEQDQANENTSLNQRGLMSGDRQNTTGLGKASINASDLGVKDTLDSYNRVLGRNQEDVNQTFNRGMFDSSLAAERGISDLTTTARRGGIDSTNTYNQGLEQASRAREQARLEAEAERRRNTHAAQSIVYNGMEKGIANR